MHTEAAKTNLAGIANINWGQGIIEDSCNEANLTGYKNVGGIASQNNSTILNCQNKGTLTLNFKYTNEGINSNGAIGGIIGVNAAGKCLSCANFGTIRFGQIEDMTYKSFVEPAMAQIAGISVGGTFENYQCRGLIDVGPLQRYEEHDQLQYVKDGVCGRME